MQDWGISSALTKEIPQSWTKPLSWLNNNRISLIQLTNNGLASWILNTRDLATLLIIGLRYNVIIRTKTALGKIPRSHTTLSCYHYAGISANVLSWPLCASNPSHYMIFYSQKLKFQFALLLTAVSWSLQNLAHATTAVLSWYVQNFVAIS